MIFAHVIVRPRTSIFDPQGEAVKHAIHALGLSSVREAHVGKCIELQLDTDNVEEARTALDAVCRDLLSNPVIEEYELKVLGGTRPRVAKSPLKTPEAKPKTVSRPVAKRVKKMVPAQALTNAAEAEERARLKALKKQEKAAKKLVKEAKKAAKKAAKQQSKEASRKNTI